VHVVVGHYKGALEPKTCRIRALYRGLNALYLMHLISKISVLRGKIDFS